MESAMSNLQTALGLLKGSFGEFDNIKLLLGAGEAMTSDSVAAELLEISSGIERGDFTISTMYAEPALRDAQITL